MTPRIYIAGAYVEVARVRAAMAAVRKLGYEVTLDWTKTIDERAARGETDRDLDEESARRYAREDLEAVRASDYFWFLVPPDGKDRGAWVEFGAAVAWLAEGGTSRLKHIVASGDEAASIFCRLVETDDSDEVTLIRLARLIAPEAAGEVNL